MLDAVLGSGLATPPTPEERRGLKRILWLRRCLWCVAGVWLAVSLMSIEFHVEMPLVQTVLIVGWCALAYRVAHFSPCPRCGGQFHGTRFTGSLLTQKCLHCGFPLRPPASER
jgi:hypothetical protein